MKEWNVGLMSHLGMRFVEVGPDRVVAELDLRRARDDRRRGPRRHADGARRYGRRRGHRVDGPAHRDARIEDQFLRRRHGRKAARRGDGAAQGQRTHVWQTRVTDERGKLLSLTIQTQMIL